MFRTFRASDLRPTGWALFLTLVACLAASAPARAAVPGVRDEAGFFTPEEVRVATGIIRLIADRYGKEVVVETYPAIPEDRREDFNRLDKEAFFDRWLKDRAAELDVDGVFILICGEPRRLQIGANARTRAAGVFTVADTDELRDTMLPAFRQREFDRGLRAGVKFAAVRIARNVERERAARRGR
jgi:uncharacterized membrane protein YgcG